MSAAVILASAALEYPTVMMTYLAEVSVDSAPLDADLTLKNHFPSTRLDTWLPFAVLAAAAHAGTKGMAILRTRGREKLSVQSKKVVAVSVRSRRYQAVGSRWLRKRRACSPNQTFF